MKRFVRITAAAAAFAMTAALTACGGDTSWTFRSEDGAYEVTSGMYVGLSMNSYNEGYAAEGVDTSLALYGQQIESKDALAWVTQKTEQAAKRYIVIEEKYDAYGLAFEPEMIEYIDEYTAYLWGYSGAAYEEEGCSEASYKKLLANSFKESEVFHAVYGEGGEREVAAEDLRAIFDEQYAHVNFIQVDASDEEGTPLTEDALQEKKDVAAELVDKIKDGENVEIVKAEYNAAETETEAAEVTDETDTSVYILSNNTYYPEALVKAIFDAEADDAGYFDDGEGTIYVWNRLANDDKGFENYRGQILQTEKWAEYQNLVTDWVNAATILENEASLKKHNPKNLE